MGSPVCCVLPPSYCNVLFAQKYRGLCISQMSRDETLHMEAYEKPSVLRPPTYYRGLFVDESEETLHMEAYEKPSVLRIPTYYRGLFVDESGRDAPHGGLQEAQCAAYSHLLPWFVCR